MPRDSDDQDNNNIAITFDLIDPVIFNSFLSYLIIYSYVRLACPLVLLSSIKMNVNY